MDTDFVLAPIRLWQGDDLLSGAHPDRLPPGTEVERDLERAMMLENSQELPPGYRVWGDAIPAAVSPFWSTPEGREGRTLIDAEAEQAYEARGDFERELNKKRIRKTITEAEEFWLTVAYDLLETLKSVALGRYVQGGEPFLEKVFAICAAGFYPCGVDAQGNPVAFDPSVLKG